MASAQDIGARNEALSRMLEQVLESNGGNQDWQAWKADEIRAVIALAGKAQRMNLLAMDLAGDLHLAYWIRMPVPRWPEHDRLPLGKLAIFDLHYQEEWRWESPLGWAPLGLAQPLDVFHPNCRPALRGAICLGRLPPGIRLCELILLGYFALTLQDRVLDETDPNGVLNPLACEYFRNHPEYLPLTSAGLLDPWEGVQ